MGIRASIFFFFDPFLERENHCKYDTTDGSRQRRYRVGKIFHIINMNIL